MWAWAAMAQGPVAGNSDVQAGRQFYLGHCAHCHGPDGEGGRGINLGPTFVLATLYAGPLATGFAFWASQTIARALPPTVTAMGMLLTPVIGLSASALFLGEAIGPLDLLGFAVTAAGIAIVTRARAGAPGSAAEAPREATREPDVAG